VAKSERMVFVKPSLQGLTPKKAVVAFCQECICSVLGRDIKECKGDTLHTGSCPFFKYRLGRGRPSVKTIRQQCKACMNGNLQLINDCANASCALHTYRMGKNPSRARKPKQEDDNG